MEGVFEDLFGLGDLFEVLSQEVHFLSEDPVDHAAAGELAGGRVGVGEDAHGIWMFGLIKLLVSFFDRVAVYLLVIVIPNYDLLYKPMTSLYKPFCN